MVAATAPDRTGVGAGGPGLPDAVVRRPHGGRTDLAGLVTWRASPAELADVGAPLERRLNSAVRDQRP